MAYERSNSQTSVKSSNPQWGSVVSMKPNRLPSEVKLVRLQWRGIWSVEADIIILSFVLLVKKAK